MQTTAKHIYNTLKNDLIGESGIIKFQLLGIETKIDKLDSVGTTIESWVGEWLSNNNFYFHTPLNSQEFPDYYLNKNDKTKNHLEVKTFNYDASPNFDIANFDAYHRSLTSAAYRVDADYLIFGYSMHNSGEITIKDIWLKKVWEISGPSGRYPLKTQVKQDIIYNIRPITWYSNRAQYNPYNSRKEFIKALDLTYKQYYNIDKSDKTWLNKVKNNYKHHTAKELFSDI